MKLWSNDILGFYSLLYNNTKSDPSLKGHSREDNPSKENTNFDSKCHEYIGRKGFTIRGLLYKEFEINVTFSLLFLFYLHTVTRNCNGPGIGSV